MVIMSHMVDSLRKHQKMIILGVALGVIALYIVPVDQIVNALADPPGLVNAIAKIGQVRAKIAGNSHIDPVVRANIDAKFASLLAHLTDVLYQVRGF